MASQAPQVPAGNGKHPITLVVISANRLEVSKQFYSRALDWPLTRLSEELVVGMLPAGPAISLRSNVPEDFPAAVPYINVPDVDAAMERVVAAGGSVERSAWKITGVGSLARFKDAGGTITDNGTNTLYFYTVDKGEPVGSELKLRLHRCPHTWQRLGKPLPRAAP